MIRGVTSLTKRNLLIVNVLSYSYPLADEDEEEFECCPFFTRVGFFCIGEVIRGGKEKKICSLGTDIKP